MIDFTKEGRVEDRVKHPAYGQGGIVEIDGEANFPLTVSFAAGYVQFTHQGKLCHDEEVSCLCFANRSITVDQGTPPERKWIADYD